MFAGARADQSEKLYALTSGTLTVVHFSEAALHRPAAVAAVAVAVVAVAFTIASRGLCSHRTPGDLAKQQKSARAAPRRALLPTALAEHDERTRSIAHLRGLTPLQRHQHC